EHRPRRLPRFPHTRVLARCWRGDTEISPDRRAGRIRPPCASPIAAIEQIPHSWLGKFKEAEGGCPQLLKHSSPPSGSPQDGGTIPRRRTNSKPKKPGMHEGNSQR